MNKRVLYHIAIKIINNKLLINKDLRINMCSHDSMRKGSPVVTVVHMWRVIIERFKRNTAQINLITSIYIVIVRIDPACPLVAMKIRKKDRKCRLASSNA